MSLRREALKWQGTFDRLEGRQLLALTMASTPISATQQQSFSGQVATVIDTNPKDSLTSFNSVQIDWGDGQTTPGQIVGPVLVSSAFEVIGTHTYTAAGSYSTLISVSTATANASAAGKANVAAPPFPVNVNTITAAPGTALVNQTVATFIAPGSDGTLPTGSSAVINWGDGQTTIGIISGGPGAFSVTGSHTYAAADTYTTSVTVALPTVATSTGVGQADIASPSQYTLTSVLIVTPVSQLFSGTVANFTDTNTDSLASNFTASIAWGDGSTTPATVTGGNGSFAVSGMYTYSSAGTYTATVTIADQTGVTFTVTDTANVTTTDLLSNAVYLTGGLADVSGNGPNAAGGYTDNDEPIFSGTTVPYAIVELYSQLSGVNATLPLGQAVATASGAWTFTSGPLTDGIYTITATVTPPAGFPSGMVPLANSGRVVIDTVSPEVVGESVVGPGRVVVSFRDDLSGMDAATLLNPDNYTFAGPDLTALHPNKVRLTPAGNLPTDTQSVLLTIKAKPRLLHHIRALRISGTNDVSVAPNVTANIGIIDKAGNALRGNFHSPANPASGRAAGNYVVKLAF